MSDTKIDKSEIRKKFDKFVSYIKKVKKTDPYNLTGFSYFYTCLIENYNSRFDYLVESDFENLSNNFIKIIIENKDPLLDFKLSIPIGVFFDPDLDINVIDLNDMSFESNLFKKYYCVREQIELDFLKNKIGSISVGPNDNQIKDFFTNTNRFLNKFLNKSNLDFGDPVQGDKLEVESRIQKRIVELRIKNDYGPELKFIKPYMYNTKKIDFPWNEEINAIQDNDFVAIDSVKKIEKIYKIFKSQNAIHNA